VFATPWPIAVFAFLALAGLGTVIGTLVGLFTSLVMGSDQRGAWKDALLGAGGILAGFMLPILLAGRHYHAEYYFDGEKPVATTSLDSVHPWLSALLWAALLPIIHETYRRARKAASTKIATGSHERPKSL
jgi:hypothetical protein